MTPLEQDLRRDLPLPLSDYMARALKTYYHNRDPLGTDFTTAPEISQMFGELLGLWVAQVWMDQGAPNPFVLLELGPGRGTLIADALRATRRVPGFHDAMQLHLIETSPVLRKEQATRVDATWHKDLSTLPTLPTFALANEFFDALPIAQFQKTDMLWRERLVGLEDAKLAFSFAPPRRNDTLGLLFPDVPDGAIVELANAGAEIAAELRKQINAYGGAALIIDYGEWRGTGDTVQALRAGKSTDPLDHPGETDLTAHVQFVQLSGNAQAQFTRQGAFLERLGITERAKTLAKALSGRDLEDHIATHRRLVHPDEMGRLFKVMGLKPEGVRLLPGFDE